MSPAAPPSQLRQILETRIAQLSVEMEDLFTEARERGRRESADQLNQAVRRLRQSPDVEELGAMLVDAAASFATGAALFRIEGQTARGERVRGLPIEAAETFRGMEIPLASAAALAGAVESRDPVIAAATPAEVSAVLVTLAGHPPEGRVSLFPLVAGEKVPALLYSWGVVQGSALELLSQVAAAVWGEISKPPEPEPSPLVTITPAPAVAIPPPAPVPEPDRAPDLSWDRLSAVEQQIHFRAQRFARVQAAELRLNEADAVQAGRTRRNLYEALRKPISAARESFRKSFFVPCPSMVDYLHLELVRTLANDDPDILGKEYPGPLA